MRDTNLVTEDHTKAVSAIEANNRKAEDEILLPYFNISINGTDYYFNSPLDSISFLENSNGIIYFQNAASTKFGWLSLKSQNPWQAGLIELFNPGEDIYLILYEKAGEVYPVTLTESRNAGEFICGNYSGTYTDANDKPVFQVSCSFRIPGKNKL